MKIKFIKLSTIILLMALLGAGCKKEKYEFSDFVKGYIVASFRCGEILNGQGTGELTERGFFIILENRADSMYTFNFPNDLIDFPPTILEPNYNGDNCGPTYFPDKDEYKIRFKYRNISDSEKIEFACACTMMNQTFNWTVYQQVIITETKIINP